MDEKKLLRIYQGHRKSGCFLEWREWKDKIIRAYLVLGDVARRENLITYGELGIRQLGISPDWLQPKIGWIVGACSEYEYEEDRPLISAVVINSETGRPSKGFWGLPGIPPPLKLHTKVGDIDPASKLEEKREEFWVKEVQSIYKQWAETK